MSGSGRSLPEFEGTDLPQTEDASPRSKFFKTHARRIFYVALAVVLVFSLIHLSGSSNASKSTESSEAASPADTSPLSPSAAAAADPFSPAAAEAAAAAVAAAKASKESILMRIMTFLLSNQFVVTGVFAAAVAGAGLLLKYLFGTYVYVHINVRPSLIVTNLDPNFKVVMDYLSKRCLPTKNQRLLEAETLKDESPQSASKQLRSSWYGVQDQKIAPQRFNFAPASRKYSMFSAGETQFKYVPYEPHGVYPNISLTPHEPSPNAAGANQPDPSGATHEEEEEEAEQPPCWARPLARFLLFFFFSNSKIYLSVDEQTVPSGSGSGDGPKTPTKWLTLSTFAHDATVLKRIVSDALIWHFEKERESNDLKIFVLSENRWLEDWSFAVSCKKRSTDSVVFDDDEDGKNILDELIKDAQNFYSQHTIKTYSDKGMPHRRGYLLYGPPGCGKTSFITVVAAQLGKDVCILNLNDKVTDNGLASALRAAPASSIIAIEDVDAIFVSVTRDGHKVNDKRQMQSQSLTFSGLLNALDGVASQEGRIIIMTTNHREKLDPALIRPGRVDVEKEIRNASRKQIEGMFKRFYRTEHASEGTLTEIAALAKSFAAKLPEYEISMAKLQGFFQVNAKQIVDSRGNFMAFSVPAAECIGKASELMKYAGDQDPSTSVFEHFWRIGLERYAAHFERQNICSVSQFKSCDIDSVIPTCVELQFDAAAISTLKKLQKEDDDLMVTSYAVADPSVIRDLFFAVFPSTGKDGKPIVHSRFKPVTRSPRHLLIGCCAGVSSPRSAFDSDETPSFYVERSLLEICSSVQKAIKSVESQANTPFLFNASIFRIKQLFEWYGHRPVDPACSNSSETDLERFVKNCESEVSQFSKRQASEFLACELDLSAFLKRLSLPFSILPILAEMFIFDVKTFAQFCRNSKPHVLCARFSLQIAHAHRLIDFCCSDEKKNGKCRSMFLLPSNQDIRTFFVAHFTSSSAGVDDKLEQHAIEFAERLCADSVRRNTSMVSYFEIEEYLIDKTPQEAVQKLEEMQAKENTAANDIFSSLYHHLFRVGMQHYAPAFLDCGATSVSRFRDIDIDSVCERFPLLALDSNAQTQLKLLQMEDETFILENYASASRMQVKQVVGGVGATGVKQVVGGVGATCADVVSNLVRSNVSLYLLRNLAYAFPCDGQQVADMCKELFAKSICELFRPCHVSEKVMRPLSFMDFVRRFHLPPLTFHVFEEEFDSVSSFVKDVLQGEIKDLSMKLSSHLDAKLLQQQRSQIDNFCSSKYAINSIARRNFLYPSTQNLCEVFILFFTQSGSVLHIETIKRHALCFSRILSGCGSAGDSFPFRARSYFSFYETQAFLRDNFSTYAQNESELTIDTTVRLCREKFEFRQSPAYLLEPDAPAPPPREEDSALRTWLKQDVFPKDPKTAGDVCRKLEDQALGDMDDLQSVEELSMNFLQASAKLKFGDAWKVFVAFKTLKSAQRK